MLYLFDPITCQKSKITYEKLEGITGKKKGNLMSPKSKQIAVVKKDPVTGEVLDEYRSMREAARKNFLCHEAVHQAIKEKRMCAGYLYEIDKEAI